METTDFCSYELSKRLKDCGFNEPCDHLYNCHGNLNRYADTDRINRNTNGHHTPSCSAPTLAHAQKWLREVKHISVRVSYIAYHKAWFADWLNLDSGEFDDTDATFATYEEALADGISVALELIEQENK